MDFTKLANSWEKYNYEEAVREDVKQFIIDNAEDYKDYDLNDEDSKDELAQAINDNAWADDNVTGNGSGSYTMSRMMADLFLVGNGDLYDEALQEFGDKFDPEAEKRDVTIRCYLLASAINEALEDEEVIKALEDAKNG